MAEKKITWKTLEQQFGDVAVDALLREDVGRKLRADAVCIQNWEINGKPADFAPYDPRQNGAIREAFQKGIDAGKLKDATADEALGHYLGLLVKERDGELTPDEKQQRARYDQVKSESTKSAGIGVIVKGLLGFGKAREDAPKAGVKDPAYPDIAPEYLDAMNSLQATARLRPAIAIMEELSQGHPVPLHEIEAWKKRAAAEGAGRFVHNNPQVLQEQLLNPANFPQRKFAFGDSEKGGPAAKMAARHQLAGEVVHLLAGMALENPELAKSKPFKQVLKAAERIFDAQAEQAVEVLEALGKNEAVRKDLVENIRSLTRQEAREAPESGEKGGGWFSWVGKLFGAARDLLGGLGRWLDGLRSGRGEAERPADADEVDSLLIEAARVIARNHELAGPKDNARGDTLAVLGAFIEQQAGGIYMGMGNGIPEAVQREIESLRDLAQGKN